MGHIAVQIDADRAGRKGRTMQVQKKARNGRIAVVTGASRGIGAAIAERMTRAGYLVVMNARSETALSAQAEALRAKGLCCEAVPGDIGKFETAQRLFAALPAFAARYGCRAPLDVLVNNAGISYIGLLQDMTPEAWDRLISTNLTGVFNACHEAIPYLIHEKSGHIINISSVWGVCGASCEAAYSASKGGVNALTMALAKELAPSGIAVNAIACGAIDTQMNAQLDAEERRALCEEIPAGRMGTPEEAAALCQRLAESGSYLTGQIIRLDGGWI